MVLTLCQIVNGTSSWTIFIFSADWAESRFPKQLFWGETIFFHTWTQFFLSKLKGYRYFFSAFKTEDDIKTCKKNFYKFIAIFSKKTKFTVLNKNPFDLVFNHLWRIWMSSSGILLEKSKGAFTDQLSQACDIFIQIFWLYRFRI